MPSELAVAVHLTVHANIANAAAEAAVAFNVPSASPYVSMMLSAESEVLAVEPASESLRVSGISS